MNGTDGIHYPFGGLQAVVNMDEVTTTDAVSIISFRPGPAGTSSAEVGDGVIVDVDFAAPGRLCTIRLSREALYIANGPLDDLIGPAGRQSVIETINARTGPRLRKLDLGPSQRQQLGSLLFGEGAAAAGRIIAAADVSDDFDEHPVVRAIARLATYNAISPNAMGNKIISDDRLDSGIGFAFVAIRDDLKGDGVLSRLNQRQYQQLVDIVARGERPVQRNPRYGNAIREQIDLLGSIIDRNSRDRAQSQQRNQQPEPEQIAAMRFPDTGTDLFTSDGTRGNDQPDRAVTRGGGRSPVDIPGPASAATPESGSAQLTSPGRLEVAYRQRPDGEWIKIFDHNLSLIATVPIINHGRKAGGWIAQAVIPTSLTIADDLHIVVTSKNDTGSDDPFERIIDAVETGKDAAQLATEGRVSDAAAQWRVCAALWNELGDKTRSNLAMAYATGDLEIARLAQLHDTVRSLI